MKSDKASIPVVVFLHSAITTRKVIHTNLRKTLPFPLNLTFLFTETIFYVVHKTPLTLSTTIYPTNPSTAVIFFNDLVYKQYQK